MDKAGEYEKIKDDINTLDLWTVKLKKIGKYLGILVIICSVIYTLSQVFKGIGKLFSKKESYVYRGCTACGRR